MERVNCTLKEATVKNYLYQTRQHLKAHLQAFQMAYNSAKRLKTLNLPTTKVGGFLKHPRRCGRG
jgi:hypothetical protein